MINLYKYHSGITLLIIILILIVHMTGCKNTVDKNDKPTIAVSILPQKYFVEKIAGEQFNIIVMIPPGESPATYDPTAKDINILMDAQLYFKIGQIEFEKTWIKDLESEHPELNFFDTSEGIEFTHINYKHGDHSHTGSEPHIWMSPNNVKIISKNIYKNLINHFPEYQEVYKSNLDKFLNELDNLHKSLVTDFASLQNRHFIIYHPALTYFARDYNLIQVPIEDEGKAPVASHMKYIIDIAKEKNIRVILVQKQFNQNEAQLVEQEINGKIIPIDPLDLNWDRQIIHIKNELLSALK